MNIQQNFLGENVHPLPSWPLAAKNICQQLWMSDQARSLLHKMDQAYQNSRDLIELDGKQEWKNRYLQRRKKLAVYLSDTNFYPHFNTLVDQLYNSRNFAELNQLLQAALLLHMSSAGVMRASSPFPADQHSFRITETILKLADGIVVDPKQLTQLAIKAQIHDVPEDFLKDGLETIQRMFGAEMRASIDLMTMPSRIALARKYPAIFRQYANYKKAPVPEGYVEKEEDRKKHDAYIQSLFDGLKNKNPDLGRKLNAALKLAFKLEQLPKLSFDELFVKIIDNMDSIESDCIDAADKSIRLFASEALTSYKKASHWFSRKRYYLSTGLAKHTLQDRIEYHKAAINSLTQMAAAQPAKRAMIEQVMAKLDERFVRIIHEYESRMNAVIDAANAKAKKADNDNMAFSRSDIVRRAYPQGLVA